MLDERSFVRIFLIKMKMTENLQIRYLQVISEVFQW